MRLALITGASSGIGAATARRLDADGWRLLLVARRAERLEALARSLREGGAHAARIPLDVTAPEAPERLRQRVEEEGALHLLVNNAGAPGRAVFGDAQGGYANVRRTMELNFDAPVRLTEALLPALRRSAPSSIVNVSSTAGRVGLPRSGAYSASKFALAGWTEALHLEERRNGVHVGLVLPGFVATEGFPQDDLTRRRLTRWIVSTPEKVADAIVEAGPGGRAERYVPRPYGLVPVGKAILPGVWRKLAERIPR